MARKTKPLFTKAAVEAFRAKLKEWQRLHWDPDSDDFANLARQTGETPARVIVSFGMKAPLWHSITNSHTEVVQTRTV